MTEAPAFSHVERVRSGDLDAMQHMTTSSSRARNGLVAEGHGVLVGYGDAAGRSIPLPDELRDRLPVGSSA